ncbi:hypothetical protein GYMLUDRAFT_166757 [Collybiopsis luxurians FD-317 M1]|uniref:Mitochondrial carrier n=1 Tax=Collybiopsis luxurians FD-317 M1 TaxID=944289 RepID=A0A0D0CXP4_9AGAR|nr:hypothetical protein GYMLUDRAFT_166757 [Collybiopsis luxurians FD-317 M1]
MTSTLPPLVQAISGAIGSASANTLTYPLDLVTTRAGAVESLARLKAVRILHSIIRSDGVAALYDGILTDTASTLVSNFFYFYIYSFLRKLLIRQLTGSRASTPSSIKTSGKPVPSVKLTVWQDLALGFLSGVASRAVSMPLSIITLRFQTGRHDEDEKDADGNNRILEAVKKIYKEQGLSGFWRGFNTTILLSLNPSITLAFYQMFRRLLALTRPPSAANGKPATLDPTPIQSFFGGAVSNSIAVALLYPLILAKTRLQVSRKTLSSASSSGPTLRTIMLDAYHGRYPHPQSSVDTDRATGLKRLYQGLEMQILKGFFNQGVTFLVKGRIEQLIVQAYVRHRLGTGVPAAAARGARNLLPTSMFMDPDDPYRELEPWNIIEHVGRRYL